MNEKGKVRKINTIHTSRTMMYAELEKVMAFALDSHSFLESLGLNVTGKKSTSGVEKTATYLKRLYGFDLQYPPFAALAYFWKKAEPHDRPLLAFIYAVQHDELLAESIPVVRGVLPGDKVAIDLFEAAIEQSHPNVYSANTRKSLAQNIASSWKQAGFVEGKVKNIRTQPPISPQVACFAFLLAFLAGCRGDFIWAGVAPGALCLAESQLRALAVDCAKVDLMQYQSAGSVTAIGFANLLNAIGSYANTNRIAD